MGRFVGNENGNTLGFLTVLEHPEHGLFGGYLVLNTFGRPLEFHCTAPIKANRAQQILYGPTLHAFLYGDQIGRTLLEKAKAEPLLVCTDREPALAIREHISAPVALVLPPKEEGADVNRERPPAEDGNAGPHLQTFGVGRNRLAVDRRAEDDRGRIADRLEDLGESFDLAEPFLRIREAIEEARQSVRQ